MKLKNIAKYASFWKKYRIGFKVPWSNTDNIYIQERLYDPGLDQTWGIAWLDGSSWILLKFPWI